MDDLKISNKFTADSFKTDADMENERISEVDEDAEKEESKSIEKSNSITNLEIDNVLNRGSPMK